MLSLTNHEKETIILFNDAEEMAEIYTCNSAWKNKLDKLCQNTKEITLLKEDKHSKTYNFPKKWIKVKRPRVLSREKRTELAERARQNFGHTKTKE